MKLSSVLSLFVVLATAVDGENVVRVLKKKGEVVPETDVEPENDVLEPVPKKKKSKGSKKRGKKSGFLIGSFDCLTCLTGQNEGEDVTLETCAMEDSEDMTQRWSHKKVGKGDVVQIVNKESGLCIGTTTCLTGLGNVKTVACKDEDKNVANETLWHVSGAEYFSVGCWLDGEKKTLDADCELGTADLCDVAAHPSQDTAADTHQKYWLRI